MHDRDGISRSAGVTVLNLQGEEIALPSLWSGRPILLSFLRHFG